MTTDHTPNELLAFIDEALRVNRLNPETFDRLGAVEAVLAGDPSLFAEDNDGLITDPTLALLFGTIFDERFFEIVTD